MDLIEKISITVENYLGVGKTWIELLFMFFPFSLIFLFGVSFG